MNRRMTWDGEFATGLIAISNKPNANGLIYPSEVLHSMKDAASKQIIKILGNISAIELRAEMTHDGLKIWAKPLETFFGNELKKIAQSEMFAFGMIVQGTISEDDKTIVGAKLNSIEIYPLEQIAGDK